MSGFAMIQISTICEPTAGYSKEIVVCSNDSLNGTQPIPSASRRLERAWTTRDLSTEAHERTPGASIIWRLASNVLTHEHVPHD